MTDRAIDHLMQNTMTTRKHVLIWSDRYLQEHNAVMVECKRVAGQGGTFEIVNKYHEGQWTSFITIYYPDQEAA